MKVINLYGDSFVKTCRDLATQIKEHKKQQKLENKIRKNLRTIT